MSLIVDTITSSCLPSKIFLLFSIFSIIASLFQKFSVIKLFSSIIATLLWFYLLHLLCKNNMEVVTWFLVFPIIIIIFVMLFVQYLKLRK